jgi:hypothetical protein
VDPSFAASTTPLSFRSQRNLTCTSAPASGLTRRCLAKAIQPFDDIGDLTDFNHADFSAKVNVGRGGGSAAGACRQLARTPKHNE